MEERLTATVPYRFPAAAILVALVGLAVGSAIGAAATLLAPRSDRFGPGIVAGGVPLSGLSEAEARDRLAAYAQRLRTLPIRLVAGRHEHRTDLASLGGDVAIDAALAAARSVNDRRARGPFAALFTRWFRPSAVRIAVPVRLAPERVASRLRRWAAEWESAPRNARLRHANGGLERVPERPGARLDAAALATRVAEALAAPAVAAEVAASLATAPDDDEWTRSARPIEVAVPTREVPPRVRLVDLAGIDTLLATFHTSAAGSSRNRLTNIRLACQAIDGLVLRPGDVFSYNETVGPRDLESGFRMAPVIVDGQLVPGVGGGICQVSSTVYNAALLADLAIVTRQHHSFPLAYVAAGRDATVSYGGQDLRIRNSLAHPVMLAAALEGTRVVVRIYGHASDRREVDLVRTGRRPIEWTRIVRRDGVVLRREVISRDVYRLSAPRRSRPDRRPSTAASAPSAESVAPPHEPGETPATGRAVPAAGRQ